MIDRERERYHQLHPAKLAVDWGTAIVAGALLWWRLPLMAAVVGFVPSIVVTGVFLSGRVDVGLERIRSLPIAQVVAPELSAGVNAVRFAGLAVAWAGCWFQQPWPIPVGVSIIVAGWWLAWRRGRSSGRASRSG